MCYTVIIDNLNPKLNICRQATGGDNFTNNPRREEKMSQAQKGNKNFLGKTHSVETR